MARGGCGHECGCGPAGQLGDRWVEEGPRKSIYKSCASQTGLGSRFPARNTSRMFHSLTHSLTHLLALPSLLSIPLSLLVFSCSLAYILVSHCHLCFPLAICWQLACVNSSTLPLVHVFSFLIHYKPLCDDSHITTWAFRLHLNRWLVVVSVYCAVVACLNLFCVLNIYLVMSFMIFERMTVYFIISSC